MLFLLLIHFIHLYASAAKTQLNKLLKQQPSELDDSDKSTLDSAELHALYAKTMPPVYAIAQKITRDDIPPTP